MLIGDPKHCDRVGLAVTIWPRAPGLPALTRVGQDRPLCLGHWRQRLWAHRYCLWSDFPGPGLASPISSVPGPGLEGLTQLLREGAVWVKA